MSPAVLEPVDAEADTRWRAWQARGVYGDRRRQVQLGRLLALVAIMSVGWTLIQIL